MNSEDAEAKEIKLADSQMSEYNKIQEQAGATTAPLRQALEHEERDLHSHKVCQFFRVMSLLRLLGISG